MFRQLPGFDGFLLALASALQREQAGLRAAVGALKLRLRMRDHGLGLVTRRSMFLVFVIGGFARRRQPRGFDFGLCAFFGGPSRGGFRDGAALRLRQQRLFGFDARFGEPGGFCFGGGARFSGAFEGFFRQLFFARRTDGIELRLAALARHTQGAFFVGGGFLQLGDAGRIVPGGRIRRRQRACVGCGRRGEIKINHVTQLIGIGIVYRTHVGQHLL